MFLAYKVENGIFLFTDYNLEKMSIIVLKKSVSKCGKLRFPMIVNVPLFDLVFEKNRMIEFHKSLQVH